MNKLKINVSSNFSTTRLAIWMIMGFLTSITASIDGSSPLLPYALKYGSGFGTPVVALTLITSLFMLIALSPHASSRTKKLALGDFSNLYPLTLNLTFRTFSFLFGLSFGAFGIWLISASTLALACAVLGAIIGGCALFWWICTGVAAQHLNMQINS